MTISINNTGNPPASTSSTSVDNNASKKSPNSSHKSHLFRGRSKTSSEAYKRASTEVYVRNPILPLMQNQKTPAVNPNRITDQSPPLSQPTTDGNVHADQSPSGSSSGFLGNSQFVQTKNKSNRIYLTRKSVSNESKEAELYKKEMELRRKEQELKNKEFASPHSNGPLRRRGSNPEQVKGSESYLTIKSALEAIDGMIEASVLLPGTLFRLNEPSTDTVVRYCKSIIGDWLQAIVHNTEMESLMSMYTAKLARYSSQANNSEKESKTTSSEASIEKEEPAEKGKEKVLENELITTSSEEPIEKGKEKPNELENIRVQFAEKYLDLLSVYIELNQELMPRQLTHILQELINKTTTAFPDRDANLLVLTDFLLLRLVLCDIVPTQIKMELSLHQTCMMLVESVMHYVETAKHTVNIIDKLSVFKD